MDNETLLTILKRLCAHPNEIETVEFKMNLNLPQEIGEPWEYGCVDEA